MIMRVFKVHQIARVLAEGACEVVRKLAARDTSEEAQAALAKIEGALSPFLQNRKSAKKQRVPIDL